MIKEEKSCRTCHHYAQKTELDKLTNKIKKKDFCTYHEEGTCVGFLNKLVACERYKSEKENGREMMICLGLLVLLGIIIIIIVLMSGVKQ